MPETTNADPRSLSDHRLCVQMHVRLCELLTRNPTLGEDPSRDPLLTLFCEMTARLLAPSPHGKGENGPEAGISAPKYPENPEIRLRSDRAHLDAIYQRLLTHSQRRRPDSPVFLGLNSAEETALLRVLEFALSPALVVNLTEAELREIRTPGGAITFVPDPESDLEDVLDSYRLAGRLAGVQVFAVDHVVAWIGDIDRAMDHARFHIRPFPREPGPVFHDLRGANALEEAAKWLRRALDGERKSFAAEQDAARHG